MYDVICIVDDSAYKQEDIESYVKGCLPDAEIHRFGCANAFLKFVINQLETIQSNADSWLMIVDMRLPIARNKSVEDKCGYEILAELRRLRLNCAAIIASSDPIDEERARRTYSHYKGYIDYKSCVDLSDDFWQLLVGTEENGKESV